MRVRLRPRPTPVVLGVGLLCVAVLCGAILLVVRGVWPQDDGQGPEGDNARAEKGSSQPRAGKPAKHPDPDDFNGDGFGDLATTIHSSHQGTHRVDTTLVVVFGSEDGLDPRTATRLPGSDGRLLRGDLDGDGYTDLITRKASAPDSAEGQAVVLYGGARGLSDSARPLRTEQGFGPLAAGDFDGDGHLDLLDGGHGGRGDPNADPRQARPASLAYGPFEDGRPARTARLDVDQEGYAAPRSATTGDFDGDGRDDTLLTYGFDAEEDESAPDGLRGALLFRGARDGLVPDDRPDEALRKALTAGGADDGTRTPSAGDVDGDGIDDLLAPTVVPTAPADGAGTGGGLTVLYGAKGGLDTGRTAQRLGGDKHQTFGTSASLGDVQGDGRPDLVANTPGFRQSDGKIVLVPGGPSRELDWSALQDMTAQAPGLPPAGPRRNEFGHIALLDTDGDRRDNIIVFAPLFADRHGMFLELRGGKKGLDPAAHRRFTPDDLGVPTRRG